MPFVHRPFSDDTRKRALERQGKRCASCGLRLEGPGASAQPDHPFGEWGEDHRMIPAKAGGSNEPENCVMLCRSCHLSAHAGARRSDISIYRNLRNVSMSTRIDRMSRLYPFYSRGHGRS